MAVLELASNSEDKPMKLADISHNQNIALSYLEQIFLKLKKVNIVSAVKGPGGGYFLSRDLELLKIIDIIDGVEENIKMTRCGTENTCIKSGVKCVTHDLWKGLGNKIRDYFSSISVKDVIDQASMQVIQRKNQQFQAIKTNKENSHITYLDHNATTQLMPEVKNIITENLEKPMNASAIHSLGREGKRIIEKARIQIANLVGIAKNIRDYQITFTGSGTEANNLIISNFKNNQILISSIEHASVLSHKKFQDNIRIIKVDANGNLDLDDLVVLLKNAKMDSGDFNDSFVSNRILVSVIYANNETGVIQNIKEITDIAHSFGALVHSDFVQAAGKIPLDLIDLDLDFITISAHKIGGPIGMGALISKATHHLVPQIIGGGQERGLRSGTENIAAIAGFGVAAEIAKNRQEIRYQNSLNLRNYLEEELLKTHPNVKIASKNTNRLPNTSLIINSHKKAETQLIAFDLKNIAISSGASCSSGKVGSSATLIAMGFNKEEQDSAIRVSIGYTTTKSDIDRFLKT